jgi:hypothetical protein
MQQKMSEKPREEKECDINHVIRFVVEHWGTYLGHFIDGNSRISCLEAEK